MEDRLNAKLTFTNSAGKVTVSAEVNDLSRLDAAVLQVELIKSLATAAEKQIAKLTE